MSEHEVPSVRDLGSLRLPLIGEVVGTDEPGVPFAVTDAAGAIVEPVAEFMRDFGACDMSSASCRSYAYDLLPWWRWLAVIGVAWDKATRTDVRDLVLWLQQAPNPQRIRTQADAAAAGSVNAKTDKTYLSEGYAPRTISHQLAVLTSFYGFHRDFGRGPVVCPVPAQDRVTVHTSPLFPVKRRRRADYRQKVPKTLPRALSEELWIELFAAMRCHRDRAILAAYISSGCARASCWA